MLKNKIRAAIGATAIQVAMRVSGRSAAPFIRAAFQAHDRAVEETGRGRVGGVITMQWSINSEGSRQAELLEEAAHAAMRGVRATLDAA